MKQTYTGGCQCGAVRFECSAEIERVIACNCSRCGRLGLMLTFVPPEDFKLLSGEAATTQYKFNKHVIDHRFCATCGVQSFAFGKRPNDGQDVIAINVRTFDGVDPMSFPVQPFDGKSPR